MTPKERVEATLRGEVANATAKQEAARIATESEGVKRVRNLIRVAG